MRKSINLVLLTVLALSSSPIGAFAHDGEDDHVNTPQYVPGPYPAAAPGTYTGQQPGYLGQPGAGHINDPNYNPGHNNSLGHQLKDAVSPGTAPAYGVPGAAPGYGYGGYQGAPVGANHVNNPYINPGHNGSVQHQMNDAVNTGQVFPGQVPVIKRSRHGGHGAGHNEHGHNH